MKSLSIRTKLISITFLVVGVCAVAITLLTVYQHQALYKETLSRNLQGLTANLADDLLPHLAKPRPDFIDLVTTLMQLERYPHIKYGVILTSDDVMLAQYNNPVFNITDQEFAGVNWQQTLKSKHALEENELLQIDRIGDAGNRLGTLIIAADIKQQLALDNSAFISQLIPLVIITILIILVISHWVQSRLINPLISLSQLASSVSETKNYLLRSDVKGSDEIAVLGQNLNEMLSIINQQDLENKRHTTKLLKQKQSLKNFANYDQLTGLPNRKFFSELLKQTLIKARRSKQEIAVMFLDLDNFKTVNDSIGHHAGDSLLKLVTERIKRHLREEDVLARLGGDEFIIILADLPSRLTAVSIADRIIKSFHEAFKIQEWKVHSGVSIGIAFNENQKLDPASLISNADVAMYEAKEGGRNQYAVFEDEMQSVQHRHMLIANELSKAIHNNDFELFYQPKISPLGGVVGLEALIRWHSDFDGWISPAEFISVAEHCGKVHDITRWVLRQGLHDLPLIASISKQRIVTSFNVSAIDIAKKDFVRFIKEQIDKNRCDPTLIEFEVTETSYIENFDASNSFFDAINKMGCSIALDDFGTGYSSLSYLTQVKANTLKIDQQFISKMFESADDRLIVESIISLAKKLNLNVCAEGIESREQFEFIADLGCELIQGYYFAKPVPINELVDVIETINNQSRYSPKVPNNIHHLQS